MVLIHFSIPSTLLSDLFLDKTYCITFFWIKLTLPEIIGNCHFGIVHKNRALPLKPDIFWTISTIWILDYSSIKASVTLAAIECGDNWRACWQLAISARACSCHHEIEVILSCIVLYLAANETGFLDPHCITRQCS